MLTFFCSIVLPDIFLKSFPVRPEELKDKLFVLKQEDGGLCDEHIVSLRRSVAEALIGIHCVTVKLEVSAAAAQPLLPSRCCSCFISHRQP